MAQIRPKVDVRGGRQNQPVRVPIVDLLVDPLAESYLTADAAAASGTITVKNVNGFGVNQVLIIGDPGVESAELIKTHASTVPSQPTITLASNTVLAHSAGARVRFVAYDQIEISNAATVGGAKTVLTTTPAMPQTILPDQTEMSVLDTTNTGGFYFVRWKNSISGNFSSYSDAMPYAGYTILSARSIIDNAFQLINKTQDTAVITDEYCFNQLNNFQYEVLRELKRWSWMQNFDSVLGQTSTGIWKVAVPTDLDDQNTQKDIYNFRIGTEPRMTWVDKELWIKLTQGVAHTTLAVAISSGNTTVTLTTSADFPDAGSIYVGANTYAYTANNRTTGVLTLSAAATTTNLINTDVFNQGFGEPLYFTTFGGQLYHFPPTPSTLNGRNYYLDYYKSLTTIALDSDTIVVPEPTAAHYFLAWKLMIRFQSGTESDSSNSLHDKYLKRIQILKQKETLGRTYKLRPRFNDFSKLMMGDKDSKQIRTGNFPSIG